jgi:predicted metalloprotease
MRWKRGRRSDNVVDARGSGGSRMGGGKGLTLGGVAIVVIVGLLSGQDPMQILGQLAGQAMQGGSVSAPQSSAPAANDEQSEFVRAVLGDTEDTWRNIFQGANKQYRDPTLVRSEFRLRFRQCGGRAVLLPG